jgi:hypothetical protein
MAKAVAVYGSPVEEMIQESGEAMLMMVRRSLWETLIRQAESEGVTPGEILDRAMRAYLEQNGSEEAVGYLHMLAGTSDASR